MEVESAPNYSTQLFTIIQILILHLRRADEDAMKTPAATCLQKRAILFFLLSLFILLQYGSGNAFVENKIETVKEILDQPQTYNLHVVTLKGKATNLQKVPPYSTGDFLCFNSYTFTLTDETGSVMIFIAGVCGRVRDYLPEPVSEGETVFVEASIQVIEPTMFPKDLVGLDQHGIRVPARKIWR